MVKASFGMFSMLQNYSKQYFQTQLATQMERPSLKCEMSLASPHIRFNLRRQSPTFAQKFFKGVSSSIMRSSIMQYNAISCSDQSIILLLADHLSHGLSLLLQPLPALQVVLPHLLQVLLEQNLPLLAVLGLLALSEDLEDVLLQQIWIWISDIDELQGILDGDLAPAGQVVHKELDKVEEVSGLQAGLIEDASLVHEGKLIFVDLSVQVLVDLPDPLIHLGLAVGEGQLCEHPNHIFFIDGQANYSTGLRFLIEGVLIAAAVVHFLPADPEEGLAEALGLDVFDGHLIDLLLEGLLQRLLLGGAQGCQVGLFQSRSHGSYILNTIAINQHINPPSTISYPLTA